MLPSTINTDNEDKSTQTNERYTIIRTLRKTLFGKVMVGIDNHTQQLVAIKFSNTNLAHPKVKIIFFVLLIHNNLSINAYIIEIIFW